MTTKLVVTVSSRLAKKYGSLTSISEALDRLVAADRVRGIETRIVYMDDAKSMKPYGGAPVKSAKSASQCKAAIDAIFRKASPEYLILLGAADVIPHVPLKNPALADGDPFAFGDIPYACDAKYSTDPAKFTGPTRVIGRLPDLVGAKDPSYLVSLIDNAAGYSSRPASDYAKFFSVTADAWKGSTSLSLKNVFKTDKGMKRVPPGGPTWSKSQLNVRSFFINCHGGSANPNFYGDDGTNQPESLLASDLAAKGIPEGAVASVECCYGAELYDPALAAGSVGICSTFLGEGGYGYFGSTTIAYGPPTGNGAADLITQYFLRDVLSGASLGRAALQAQQRFIQNSGSLDPIGLKTLAQFILLGDPSIHPVVAQGPKLLTAKTLVNGVSDAIVNFAAARGMRRKDLVNAGLALAASVASAQISKAIKAKPALANALGKIALNAGLKAYDLKSFNVVGGMAPKLLGAKAAAGRVFHLLQGDVAGTTNTKIPRKIAVVVESIGTEVVDVREYHKKSSDR